MDKKSNKNIKKNKRVTGNLARPFRNKICKLYFLKIITWYFNPCSFKNLIVLNYIQMLKPFFVPVFSIHSSSASSRPLTRAKSRNAFSNCSVWLLSNSWSIASAVFLKKKEEREVLARQVWSSQRLNTVLFEILHSKGFQLWCPMLVSEKKQGMNCLWRYLLAKVLLTGRLKRRKAILEVD